MSGFRRLVTVILCLGVAMWIASCSAAENRKLWYDKTERQEFIDALKAREIPFRVDSEGGVWYPSDQVGIIDQISKSILDKRVFPAVSYRRPEDAALFKRRLMKASIPFEVKIQRGREWITWDKRYDAQVRAIQDKLNQEELGKLKRQRGIEQ